MLQLAKCYASDGLVLEAKTGGTFKFFSGNVYGTFRELVSCALKFGTE